MLNRKTKSPARQSKNHSHGRNQTVANKTRPARRRFVISSKSASASHAHGHHGHHGHSRPAGTHNGHNKATEVAKGRKGAKGSPQQKTSGLTAPNSALMPPGTVDLTETVK